MVSPEKIPGAFINKSFYCCER
ncbi:hypothetical protein PSJ71_24925 [Escherichia coli]|nr:hypothetical protein [Escherichia coli]